jgi:hypothetical protein
VSPFQIPERSGLPSGFRGAGAVRFAVFGAWDALGGHIQPLRRRGHRPRKQHRRHQRTNSSIHSRLSTGLLHRHVLNVLFVFVADVLQEFVVWVKQHRLEGYSPRFGVGLWIIDRELDVEVADVASPEALNNV